MRWSLGAVLAGLRLALCPAVALVALVQPAGAQADTASFPYTGDVQSWVVPADVHSATFTLAGAGGGGLSPSFGAPGGMGAIVTSTLPVVPGETLLLYVGSIGRGPGPNSSMNAYSTTDGAFGGGGAGNYNSAGGGGATDVRRGPTLADRLLVAGGGGGDGGPGAAYAGGDSGKDAPDGGFSSGRDNVGTGGSETAAGEPGRTGAPLGSDGANSDGGYGGLGQGGAGGLGDDNQQDGGGGGGGVYGGGGGAGGYIYQPSEHGGTFIPAYGGGGGGSKAAGGTVFDGANPGNGSAVITYSPDLPNITPPSITIVAPADGATYTQGQTVTASYACSAPPNTTVASCTGSVPNGAPVDTSKPGAFTFIVSALDGDGGSVTQTTSYTVTGVPPPTPTGARPTVSRATETAKAWRETNALATISSAGRKVPKGTTFSFALNERASVTFSFTQPAAGRRVHGKCVAPAFRNRGQPRCTRTIVLGRLTFTGHQGTNQVHFGGPISRTNTLRPGHYTLQITATNARRKRSSPRYLTFTILE